MGQFDFTDTRSPKSRNWSYVYWRHGICSGVELFRGKQSSQLKGSRKERYRKLGQVNIPTQTEAS
jgi:hypothetical protein